VSFSAVYADVMAIESLDHVQLAMPAGQEAQAAGFYRDLLGIPEVTKPPHLAARGGCWFESSAVKIHLGVDPEFRPARKAHPALLVSDLPKLIERLRSAGVPVRDDEPLDGYERVYVDDPFGNRIELMEPKP
jgi:catechol 2,3-dioxygenase-like lactoylglutathione lyase family enzyme